MTKRYKHRSASTVREITSQRGCQDRRKPGVKDSKRERRSKSWKARGHASFKRGFSLLISLRRFLEGRYSQNHRLLALDRLRKPVYTTTQKGSLRRGRYS